MVANIEGLAGFTKRNRRSCEIFMQGVRKLWGHGDFVSKPMTLPEIDHVIFVALMRRHFSPVNVGGSHGQLVCPYMGLIRAIVVRMRKVLAIPQSRSQSPRVTLVQRNKSNTDSGNEIGHTSELVRVPQCLYWCRMFFFSHLMR